MIDTIVRALNKWLAENHYTKNGWFIGRTYEEDTAFNAYKNMIGEIYYHIDDKNILIVKQSLTLNKTTAIDIQREKFYIELLNTVFSHLEEIENKIGNVEQIPDAV